MTTKVEVDRKALAAKVANGEKLSVEEVMALNSIASEAEKEVEAEKEAEKVAKFAHTCIEELGKFSGDGKELKKTLRNMANNVPVSANGSTYKKAGPIDPEDTKKGSTAEAVVEILKAGPSTEETLKKAVAKRFPDKKAERIEKNVGKVLKRLGDHVVEKEGKLSIA